MSTSFAAKKSRILETLSAEEYSDLSPKGTLDEKIKPILRKINDHDGLVTTSSCAGRVSVFLEGRSQSSSTATNERTGDEAQIEQLAGPGGKGGGGTWLYVSHDPVEIAGDESDNHFMAVFGLQKPGHDEVRAVGPGVRYIHVKFEAMVSTYCDIDT